MTGKAKGNCCLNHWLAARTHQKGMLVTLTGEMSAEFEAALKDAFRTRIDLRRMLSHQLERNFDKYAGTGGLDNSVFELVDAADAGGWTDDLLVGALRQNPGNHSLQSFYKRYHIALMAPSASRLQSMIKPKVSGFDLNLWVQWLISTGRQVCLIRVPTEPIPRFGTGFLIGPGVVMTAYHVLKDMFRDSTVAPETVTFTFDYATLPDGIRINQGVTYTLRGSIDDWCLFAAEGSRFDKADETNHVPSHGDLDIAIVQLNEYAELRSRGWISLESANLDPRPNDPLMMIHHPATSPLIFTMDSDSVAGTNSNGTRIQYRINTRGGSSGAPCFSFDQALVAVHQKGDEIQQQANQGVSAAAILKSLRDQKIRFPDLRVHRWVAR